MNRNWSDVLTLVLMATLTCVARAEELSKAPADEVSKQIEQLIEGDPIQRRDATAKLLELGTEAVEPLAKEAGEAKPVSMYHCFDVLSRLLMSENEATSSAAKSALDKLTQSETRSVALRAKSAIRIKEILGRRQAAGALAPAPVADRGVLKLSRTENGRTIELERAADGSFSGKIKESVNGEEKTTDLRAADAKELEQKFPEAHQTLQKHLDQLRNGQKPVNPQGWAGGGINANVQINGGVGQRVQIRMAKGVRTIDIQNGDEKIEIRDKSGKDIEIKHTRPVDGKAKTDEYKGADLDDLKQKHPDAAKLYQRFAPGNGIAGGLGAGGVGRIQIQAGGGGFRVGPPPVRPTDFEPISPGPRVIRARMDDQKIEITDEDSRHIRVKITKNLNGIESVESFTADDLNELKMEHPDVAKLYEKYAGPQSE